MISIARFPLAAALLVLAATAQADVNVRVKRDGEAFDVEATAELQSGIPGAWQVLTDYGRLAEFIPDMERSRVLFRNGNRCEIEQKGEARLLIFSFPIDVRLAVTEYPQERIVSYAIAGNFREMVGEYKLESRQEHLLLRYTGRVTPDFDIPPIIGLWIMKHHVERTFGALVDEIERRNAPRPAPDKGQDAPRSR